MSLKNLYIAVAITTFVVVSHHKTIAQADSLNYTQEATADKLPRPQVELGFGTLSYFGDIGNLGGYGKSYDLNWAYNLTLRNRISNSFGLNIYALFGKVSSSEQFKRDNINFETDIKMGGLSVEYNFDALLPKNRNITPYVSLGISTFEFNPKSDMHDAEGNKYHYWDDGTLRRGPYTVSKENASDVLIRDGVYETDLRNTNDGIDKYNLRSFSMPLGAGALLNLTGAFTLRMGAEFHFTLTDNIDNIDSKKNTYTKSKKGNDYLLYSSLALSYNLHYSRKKNSSIPNFNNQDLQGIEFEDEDSDGVADIVDLCPFTPTGVAVDMYGCPVDSDKDGVPDYLDFEPNSASNAYVDAHGVTLTDEDFEHMYLTYSDTIGNLQLEKSATYTTDIALKRKALEKNFRVFIRNTSDLSPEQISRMLSVPDLDYQDVDGNISYYIGNFATLNEALQRNSEIGKLGIETDLIMQQFGETTRIDETELEYIASDMTYADPNPNQITFRIQIGAYRNKLSKDVFANLPNLLVIEGNDGLVRYLTGSFPTIEDAAAQKIELLLKGFDGAFILSYRSGKRITLEEAGAAVTTTEDISLIDTPVDAINPKFVSFTVQLGSFDGRVPADILAKYMEIGNVRPLRGSNGDSKYVYSKFDTQIDANNALSMLKKNGFNDAFIVGEFNGQIIPASEAIKMKGN